MKAAPLLPIEEQMMFWQEHSSSVTQFAQLEQALAALVASAFARERISRKALREAFFGIEAFRSKLEFADRYVHALADGVPGLLGKWEPVRRKCESASQARNMLAHWLVIHVPNEKPGRRTVLVPPALRPSQKQAGLEDWQASGKLPSIALGVRQLFEIRLGIFEAMVMVERFHAAAAGRPDPFDGFPPIKAPTLRAMTTAFRTMAKALASPHPG